MWDRFWDRFAAKVRHFGMETPAGSSGTSRIHNSLPDSREPALTVNQGVVGSNPTAGAERIEAPTAVYAVGAFACPYGNELGSGGVQRVRGPEPASVGWT